MRVLCCVYSSFSFASPSSPTGTLVSCASCSPCDMVSWKAACPPYLLVHRKFPGDDGGELVPHNIRKLLHDFRVICEESQGLPLLHLIRCPQM
jgi:hypothetical protein